MSDVEETGDNPQCDQKIMAQGLAGVTDLVVIPSLSAIADEAELWGRDDTIPDDVKSVFGSLGRMARRAERMVEATLKPDPSPVCVEISRIQWDRSREKWWLGDTPFGRYDIWGGEGMATASWEGSMLDPIVRCEDMASAEAAIEVIHERRTLELVNARSVESVKAEYADQIASLAAEAERCGLTDKAEHFRIAEREVRYGARSLTEGEG